MWPRPHTLLSQRCEGLPGVSHNTHNLYTPHCSVSGCPTVGTPPMPLYLGTRPADAWRYAGGGGCSIAIWAELHPKCSGRPSVKKLGHTRVGERKKSVCAHMCAKKYGETVITRGSIGVSPHTSGHSESGNRATRRPRSLDLDPHLPSSGVGQNTPACWGLP